MGENNILTRANPTSPRTVIEAASTISTSRAEWLFLVVVLVYATGLRLWGLTDQSLTMDEVNDISVARSDGDLFDLVKGGKRFPPLYHLILRGWFALFPGDLAGRWLAVFLGLLSILVVWRLARNIAGPQVGFWAAVFVSMSPFHIWYSQESRVYGLFLLLAALSLLWFARAIESDTPRDWAVFMMCATAGLFTHYYFILVVATTAALVIMSRRGWGRLRAPFLAYAGIAAACVPWLILLFRDLEGDWGASRTSAFGVASLGFTFASFITGYTVGPSLRELHSLPPANAALSFLPWVIFIGFAVAVLIWSGLSTLRNSPWRFYLVVIAFLPVFVVGIGSEIGPFGFNVRHVIWVYLPVAIWAGAGLARWRQSPIIVAAGLAIFTVFGIALCNRHLVDRYRNEDAAAVGRFLESSATVAPVLVSAEYMARPVDFSLSDSWQVFAVRNVGLDGAGLAAALRTISEHVDHEGPFWFAYSRSFHGDPGGFLLNELSTRTRMDHVASFAGFDLYHIEFPRDESTKPGIPFR